MVDYGHDVTGGPKGLRLLTELGYGSETYLGIVCVQCGYFLFSHRRVPTDSDAVGCALFVSLGRRALRGRAGRGKVDVKWLGVWRP